MSVEPTGPASEDRKHSDATTTRYGRRSVMVGTAAVGAGILAGLVAGAEPAEAANGESVHLGQSNSATATTKVSTTSGHGLQGQTTAGGKSGLDGVDKSSGGGYGVKGVSTAGYGVEGESSSSYGVHGTSTSYYGVRGDSSGFYAAVGGFASGTGASGVYGAADGVNGFGVFGFGGASGSTGVFAEAGSSAKWALVADGATEITGPLSKPSGSFKIDHPLDPAGKYLYHSFVESPDMKNVYDGTAVLDADGKTTVELPEWFEALNRDFRYALTALDRPAPDLHISARVADGRFSIAGGQAGQEVSWQVTGIRQDAWANAHRIQVEVEKPVVDRGRYLHPELYGGEAISTLATARAQARAAHMRRPTPT